VILELKPASFVWHFLSRAKGDIVMANPSIRLSVCPSIRPMMVLCLNEWTCRHAFWHLEGAPFYFLIPAPNRRYKISRGIPFVEALSARSVGEFCNYRFLSWKRYEIGPWLLRITNRNSWVADRSMSVPLTLSDLERTDARVNVFWRISVITAKRFHLERRSLVW